MILRRRPWGMGMATSVRRCRRVSSSHVDFAAASLILRWLALASPFSMNSMHSGALRYAQCQWLSIQTQGCLWSVHELSDADSDSDLRMKLSQLQAPSVSGHLLVWTGGQKTSYWVAMELLLLLSLRGRRRLGNGEDKIGW